MIKLRYSLILVIVIIAFAKSAEDNETPKRKLHYIKPADLDSLMLAYPVTMIYYMDEKTKYVFFFKYNPTKNIHFREKATLQTTGQAIQQH